jgi:hypothetical protein
VSSARPDPGDIDDETEFRRWYWTVAELRLIAQHLHVPTSGTKVALADRIADQLAGRPATAVARPARNRIPAPLTPASVIPPGVILDRQLRDWFVAQVGPSFRSDTHLRTFLRDSPGATLGDALAHWHATRDAPAPDIEAQFEFNRFVREHRADQPSASHADVVAAWRQRRSQPREQP